MPEEYKQAFVLTMENGAVVLAVVMGEDGPHGEGLACSAAQDTEECQIWDSATYPVWSDLPVGVHRLLHA